MSKINDLLDALKTRVETISGITAAVKRPRKFSEGELPGIALYRGQSQVQEVISGSQSEVSVPLVVEYHKAQATDDPAAEAEAMIDAVIAAVEVDDYTDCHPLQFEADKPTLPEDAGGVIVVQVQFSAGIVRQYGGASV